jgi:hypothetical protein
MYENILSNYKRVYSRSPSHLNLVYLWYCKDIETKKEIDQASKKAAHILRHMASLGIEISPSNDPKLKKSHSCRKLKQIH